MLESAKWSAAYGTHSVRNGQYSYLPAGRMRPEHRDVAGAVAQFEAGGAVGGRTTLTRVAAGAVIAGPVGAIVGGLFKKDRSKVYVTVTFPDGAVVIVDGPAKDELRLRQFAVKVNEASVHYAPQADPLPE